ncbi:TPA: SusD/RagB family nutrient-binding outer membrane lipoprotein [Elizabethkingia anophelis]
MKKKILLLSILGVLSSCGSDMTSLNEDPKTATNVSANNVFAGGVLNTSDQMNTSSMNSNQFRMFVQQLADVEYLEGGAYKVRKRSLPDSQWDALYGQLQNFENAKVAIKRDGGDAAVVANKLAATEIMEIYCYQTLVDTFGDVPYSQALNPAYTSPKYDDAKSIYVDLLKRLDVVIATINPSAGAYGNDDFIYKGNMSKWIKFAAALKIKMGINLADSDAALSKTAVESGYQLGTFANQSESARIQYNSTGIYTSPSYRDLAQSGRVDYCLSNIYLAGLTADNDPRISSYFTTVGGVFKAGKFGTTNPTAASDLSLIKPSVYLPDSYGYFSDYVEIEFILAEAAARGYAVGADAAAHFKNALSASLDLWGVNAADKAAYLAANDYNSLSGTFREKIGTQVWHSMYNRGFEAWTFFRRLDYPKLTTQNPTSDPIPMRLPYPTKESSINSTNMYDAINKLSSKTDSQGDKIFWDKN